MKRFSTMLAVSLAVSMVVVACASMQSGGKDLVTRAVSAQGGADTLAAVKTISYKATVRQWEPEQSAKAGGEVRLANDSIFGLGASLWTQDRARAQRLAAQIEAGAIFVNGIVKSDPRLPFGGIKRSGYGRELSEYGIREFVNIKSVWIA